MKKGTFLTLALGLILWACQSGLDSPSSPSSQTVFPEGIQQQTGEPAQPAAPNEGGDKGCEIVQVQRSGIKLETRCSEVRFYVPATVTLGTGYYNMWLPAVNAGEKLGPFSYNEWTAWTSIEVGTYTYTLAAETKTDSGKVYQCDRHKGTFKVECPCVQGSAPKCEFGLAVYNPRNCTYQCPPCEMPPLPECSYGLPLLDGCGWKCPQCDYTIAAPKVGAVFCHNLVLPKNECQHFAPGTVPFMKIDGSSSTAEYDALVVIQKKGGGPICGHKKRYIVYEDVQVGDPLKSGWSHTTYCRCADELR